MFNDFSSEMVYAVFPAFFTTALGAGAASLGLVDGIDRSKLEYLIHCVFAAARLDIEVKDRFGNPVVPQEWFLVPRFVIDEAVEKIKDGTIADYKYDPEVAALVRI